MTHGDGVIKTNKQEPQGGNVTAVANRYFYNINAIGEKTSLFDL